MKMILELVFACQSKLEIAEVLGVYNAMIKINKSQALPELVALPQKESVNKGLDANTAFKNLLNPLKTQVLQQLSRDQGALCAYCMRRIPDDRGLPHAKIEHLVPRNGKDVTCGAFGALDYNNMLAVCSGNEPDKSKHHELTCDASRGNAPLTVNPLDESRLALFIIMLLMAPFMLAILL